MKSFQAVSMSDSEYELAAEDFLGDNDDHIDKVISSNLGQDPVDFESKESTTAAATSESYSESQSKEVSEIVAVPYTDEELDRIRNEVLNLKDEANKLYKLDEYPAAMEIYGRGLELCRSQLDDLRSVLFSNRAACHLSLSGYSEAEDDCTKAIELNEKYVKALSRRACAREKLEKLSLALEDYESVIKLQPDSKPALEAVRRLPKEIEVQQEKMKEECISKLKDLGNLVLKPFGLSTNNFNMVQNSETGGYNIQFSQEDK